MKRTLKIFRINAYDFEGRPWEPPEPTRIPDVVLDWYHKSGLDIDPRKLSVMYQFDHITFERLIALIADVSDEEWFILKLKGS